MRLRWREKYPQMGQVLGCLSKITTLGCRPPMKKNITTLLIIIYDTIKWVKRNL